MRLQSELCANYRLRRLPLRSGIRFQLLFRAFELAQQLSVRNNLAPFIRVSYSDICSFLSALRWEWIFAVGISFPDAAVYAVNNHFGALVARDVTSCAYSFPLRPVDGRSSLIACSPHGPTV